MSRRRIVAATVAAQSIDWTQFSAVWDFSRSDTAFVTPTGLVSGSVDDTLGLWLDRRNGLSEEASIYDYAQWDDVNGHCVKELGGWTKSEVTGSNALIRHSSPVMPLGSLYRYIVNSARSSGTGGAFLSNLNYAGGNTSVATGTINRLCIPINEAGTGGQLIPNGAFIGFSSIESITPINSIPLYQTTSAARPTLRVDARGNRYAELDLVDDEPTAVLPAISGGKILIATSRGIWVDDFDFAGGTWSFGPTTYTGGANNLFDGLKDTMTDLLHVYGIVLIDRPLTTKELNGLVGYYTSRCGEGIIFP